MKKKRISVLILVAFTICSIFLVIFVKGNFNIKKCDIADGVNEYLLSEGVYDCDILSVGKITIPEGNKDDIEVTDEEINNYIEMMLATYSEALEITDRAMVISGDFVHIDYYAYIDDVMVKSDYEVEVEVGKGYFNSEIEEKLIGAEVDKPFELNIIAPEDSDDKTIAGQNVKFYINVTSILKYKNFDLTDQFVEDHFKMNNVEEYKNSVKDILYKKESIDVKNTEQNTIIDSIIDKSNFDLDNEIVANYSVKIVDSYNDLAYSLNMKLEDYVLECLKKNKDEFYDQCYKSGEYEIKRVLVIGAIAQKKNIQISLDEFEKYYSDKGYTEEQMTDNTSLKKYLLYKAIEEKVLEDILKL